MIFALSGNKVLDKINRLIDELVQYDVRIKAYEEQSELAVRLGISSFDEGSEVREWRASYDEIYDVLADARIGVRSGSLDYRVVNQQLSSVKRAIRNFKRVLDETDALVILGKATAQKRLGI